MTSVYSNPTLDRSRQHAPHGKRGAESYSGYVEPDTDVPPKPAAIVGDVTVNGVLIGEAEILAEAQNHPAANPGEALRLAAWALAVRQLLLQEARRLDVRAPAGMDGAGRVETEEDALIRCLIEREVNVPDASERECRRFYEVNPGKLSSSAICEARHILLAVTQDDKQGRAEAREKARNFQEHLAKAPHEFGALAVLHSDCPSAQQGGNLGQLTSGSTVPEFEKALGAMQPGDSPSVIETRFGVHIVMLDRRIEGELLPFEHVRERISAWLEAASWSRAVSQYISILAGQADIRGIELEGANGALVQ
jgi:peptidyl-prolyl cis-trans isomerase C